MRAREETIATVTINIRNIRQFYTTYPQTDGILVLVYDEGDITREIKRAENINGYNKHEAILHHSSTNRWYISISKDEGEATREI